MKMTVFLEPVGWFDVSSEVSFIVKDLDMAREIVEIMILNGANVRNAVVYDVHGIGGNDDKKTEKV